MDALSMVVSGAEAQEVHLEQADFFADGAFELGEDVVVAVL